MSDWDKFLTDDELTGRPAQGTPSRSASAREATQDPGDWLEAPSDDRGFTTASVLPEAFGRDWSTGDTDDGAEAAAADEREVTAFWALWGKDDRESGYHVLRCSEGRFGPGDFHGIISRYASGVKERLPQYTVCWIPEVRRGAAEWDSAVGNDSQGYLAVGIHELADEDPRHAGGRARTFGGREIEYVRLFCVRFAALAEFGTSYTDLVDAVLDYQLPAASAEPLYHLKLPATAPLRAAGPRFELAANIATLLLTLRPVCVLGAEAISAKDRLGFIELVMSLLPYGLRTTMSASTWASPTAQDLKLRLFFSSAKLDDRGRTCYVTWGVPGKLNLPAADDAPSLYYGWLRQAGSHAVAELASLTDPVRFDPAAIRMMVANLPADRPVEESLRELASNLQYGDLPAVSAGVKRLRRYLGHPLEPAERQAYRQLIARLGLLRDHPKVPANTRASIYRVLLGLAYEESLTYTGYCDIEDAVGGPPRGTLRSVLLKNKFTTFLPWMLTAKAEPEFTDEDVMRGLAKRGTDAADLLTGLQSSIADIRVDHRTPAYDFTVQYLCAYGQDSRGELKRRGYLMDTLEAIHPGDQKAQRRHLENMLVFIYRGRLKRDQIRDLFAAPGLYPTPLLESAVKHLAASRRAGRFIEEQAAYARLRYQGGDPTDLRRIQSSGGARRLPELNLAGTILGGFPKKNLLVIGIAIIIAAVCTAIVIVVLAHRLG